jgi:hypothetical protein
MDNGSLQLAIALCLMLCGHTHVVVSVVLGAAWLVEPRLIHLVRTDKQHWGHNPCGIVLPGDKGQPT